MIPRGKQGNFAWNLDGNTPSFGRENIQNIMAHNLKPSELEWKFKVWGYEP